MEVRVNFVDPLLPPSELFTPLGPQMRSKDIVLDLHVLNPAALVHESARLSALSSVRSAVTLNADLAPLLAQLQSVPNLLEFVLSASPKCSQVLSAHILSRYPTTPEAFSSSFANTLLQKFYFSLFSAQRSLPVEISEQLDGYRKSVSFAPGLLEELGSIIISGALNAFPDSPESPSTRKKQQKKTKRNSPRINVDVFKKAGCDVPENQEAAELLALEILEAQKHILQQYLKILSHPAHAQIFQAAYFPQTQPRQASESVPTSTSAAEDDRPIEETPAEPASAYPMVQPMKAALYFDSALGFGEWRILLSTRATRNLRESRRNDASTFKIIVKKIKELSNGQFSADNQKRLNGHDMGVHIFEAKMTRDLRLVYQVDCVPEYNSDVERQVLRVFGIYTHAQIDQRFWDSMASQLVKKGKEYRRRCNVRKQPKVKGDYVIDPEHFPAPPLEAVEHTNTVLDLPHEHLDEMHSLLVLEKFVAFSQALLNSIIADQDVSHVFAVTPQEKEIIEHNSSCYVLGRSGTGKTTTMLFKMLGIERAWVMHSGEDIPKPRQLFVTQSRVLAGKVEEYFLKLLESLATASLSPREIAKLAKEKHSHHEDGGLVDLDDDTNWRNDLPERFSQLEDQHFPLFITFDGLCKLLEADMLHASTEETDFVDTPPKDLAVPKSPLADRGMLRTRSIVTYETFRDEYWPHFPQALTKGLDPSLIFSEIMGVIKGCEDALASNDRHLDQRSYERLSHRSQSTFSHQRTIVYALFEAYTKRKKLERHFDSADRTHSLLQNLQFHGLPGTIDFLYVDEAQDNLLIDALLLRSLCRNAHGLFWAGDTAQTISVGSSFRFNDLKAFLFRIEQSNSAVAKYSSASVPPKSFQLAVNYRSHGGIVSCAHSVVELITAFWPYAIDTLSREVGVVDGLKPVFFHGWDSDTVRYEQFLFGSAGNHIEFGAQQVILVRDENAREKLRQEVGDIGVIMTLYESKGLEFNDVLLYNFFEDSTADLSQWRVVLNAADGGASSLWLAPRFDDSRHAGICSELKFLYVAITRARKNMWIVDCSEKSEPMRLLWSSKHQVKCCTPGSDVPRLAVSSTSAEWADTGEKLFKHKKYLQAMHCFDRGGMRREVDVANAYFLREQAYTRKSGNTSKKPFLIAAEAFLECASAAIKDKEKRAYFSNAGKCFVSYGDDTRAAKAFYAAKEYALAAQHYRADGLFDEAVHVIQTHRQDIQPDIANKIYDIARIYYFQDANTLNRARDLFDTADEAIEFADDFNLDLARAKLLNNEGRYAEAAEAYLSEGRLTEAVGVFLSHLDDPKCARSAIDKLLQGFWDHLSFGIAPEGVTAKPSLQQWLRLANQLKPEYATQAEQNEISMFSAIIAKKSQKLQRLGLSFYHSDNKPAALLCLDHVFNNPLKFDGPTLDEKAISLEVFYAYAQLLRDVAFVQDPCDRPFVQKLFAIQPLREDSFALPVGTFLYDAVAEQGALLLSSNTEQRTVPSTGLSKVLKATLSDRVRTRVMDETEAFMRARFVSPCLYFLANSCHRTECTRAHVGVHALDPAWYNTRVRIHLQQIMVFQILHCVDIGEKRWYHQRQLLDRFHEVLNPLFSSLGSQAILDLTRLPEAEKAFKVVKDWVRHLVYTGNPWTHQTFMTTFLRAGVLGFSLDSPNASEYMYHARCITSRSKPPPFLVHAHGRNIVLALIDALHDTKPWSIQAGFLFVQHVLLKKILINVSVLCDFVERLCGRLIVLRSYQKTSTFDGITLPRSWIVDMAKDFTWDAGDRKDTKLQQPSLNALVGLLRRIYSGIQADHLIFESRPVSGQPAHFFVARMCRAISLLGYNMEHLGLRSLIGKDITSLHVKGREIHRFYRRYFNASTWEDVVGAMMQSAIDMRDELIGLRDERAGKAPLTHPVGIRQTDVQNPDDLDQVFGTDILTKNILLHGTSTTMGRNLGSLSQALQNDVPETFVSSNSHDDTEAFVQPVDVTEHPEEIATFTEEQLEAAKVFQFAYHRLLLRRGKGDEGALAIKRNRLFLECSKAAEKIPWERPNAHAYNVKGRLKKRINNAHHRDLDEAQAKMTDINRVLKECNRLQKALQPSAPIHVRQNSRELGNLARDAEALLRSRPCIDEYKEDLLLAVKGIITQRSQKKKQKPELNIDDVLDDYI